MYGTLPLSGPGDGLFPPTVGRRKIRNVTAATAFTVGSVVMLDVAQTRVAAMPNTTYSTIPGHATAGVDDSVFNCCILPTTAGIAAGYPIFVCEEAIAAGAVGAATIMGPGVKAKVAIASGDVGAGANLVPTNGSDLFVSSVSATNATWMVGAWALASSGSVTATGSSTVLANVWLNGRFVG